MALNIVKDIDSRVAVKNVLMSVSDKSGLEAFVPALVKACLDAGMCHYNHPEEEGIVALPGGTVWSGQESFLQLRGKNPERIPAEMRAVLNGVLSV